MRETGIIMSGNHPRDIIELRKTMTRRTWGLEKINKNPDDWMKVAVFQDGLARFCKHDGSQDLTIKCPYGGYGMKLWIRETFWEESGDLYYKSDWGNEKPVNMVFDSGKWKPSIFMPRWASRIERIIILLRIERLRDISEVDAKAEGGYTVMEFIETFLRLNHLPNDANPWLWCIGW